MNFTLHKHKNDSLASKIPDGLQELLSDISREVLRDQPENIYEYIADYLDAMLLTREQSQIAERTMNEILDVTLTISNLMETVGLSMETASQSAAIIEDTLRKNLVNDQQDSVSIKEGVRKIEQNILEVLTEKCNYTKEELVKVQRIIQVAFKNYYFREKEYVLKLNRLPNNHWANKVEQSLALYRNSAPEPWELERAAVTIQAAYRGYYSRKMPLELIRFNENATKIQAVYRGRLTRKQISKEHDAAIAIQTRYRGYRSRKILDNQANAILSIQQKRAKAKTRSKKTQPMTEESAAIKIQANYKGYSVRKELNQKLDAALKLKAKLRGLEYESSFSSTETSLEPQNRTLHPSLLLSSETNTNSIIINSTDDLSIFPLGRSQNCSKVSSSTENEMYDGPGAMLHEAQLDDDIGPNSEDDQITDEEIIDKVDLVCNGETNDAVETIHSSLSELKQVSDIAGNTQNSTVNASADEITGEKIIEEIDEEQHVSENIPAEQESEIQTEHE